jgi:iron complex transport system ATP-binding protein
MKSDLFEASVVSAQNVSFIRGGKAILKDINFQLGRERLVIDAYELSVEERRKIISVFQPSLQEAAFIPYSDTTALEVILSGETGSYHLYKEPTAQAEEKAKEFLHGPLSSSITENMRFADMSAGEKRKILFFRMLMLDPSIIIFDEPFESLDIPSRLRLSLEMTRFLEMKNTPFIMILHRIEEIPEGVNKLLLLKNGKILAYGNPENIMQDHLLSELYECSIRVIRHGNSFACTASL